jgi:DNA-binding CsgD family transcriptional regulator
MSITILEKEATSMIVSENWYTSNEAVAVLRRNSDGRKINYTYLSTLARKGKIMARAFNPRCNLYWKPDVDFYHIKSQRGRAPTYPHGNFVLSEEQLALLSDNERTIMQLRYGGDKKRSFAEIARIVGVTRQHAQQTEARVRRRLGFE